MGSLHCLSRVGFVGWIGGALVERHHDVRADLALNLHDGFRSKDVPGAIDVRLKLNPVRADSPETGQTEHLEPARIRKQRAVPSLESVQAARCRDPVLAGAQVKVIRIAENDPES